MNGWILIRNSTTRLYDFKCENGMIHYQPNLKYRLEKKNAFDPSFIHQREPYREDSFDLEGIIMPDEFQELLNLLTDDGMLYLEYSDAQAPSSSLDATLRQFPVWVKKLPDCPDDLLEYPEKVKISLESRYIGTPGYVDFSIITISDFDEIVI